MSEAQKKSVKKSSSLAEKFKNARKKLKVNLLNAQLGTKISQKYIRALESGDYSKLPEPVYTRGFITRYAEFLNLKVDDCLASYQGEQENSKQHPKLKSRQNRNVILSPHASDLNIMNRSKLIITPEIMWGGILGSAVLGIFGYIWFAVASFAAAPSLEINSPDSEVSVQVEKVMISGKTDPDAELEINSQFVSIDSEGKFNEEIRLTDGINAIQINAKNKINKTTTKNLKLLAEIPEEQYGPFLQEVTVLPADQVVPLTPENSEE